MDWFLYDNGFRHERVKLAYLTKLIQFFPISFLKEELTHCGLRYRHRYQRRYLEVSAKFEPKNHTRKLTVFTEVFRIIPTFNS